MRKSHFCVPVFLSYWDVHSLHSPGFQTVGNEDFLSDDDDDDDDSYEDDKKDDNKYNQRDDHKEDNIHNHKDDLKDKKRKEEEK